MGPHPPSPLSQRLGEGEPTTALGTNTLWPDVGRGDGGEGEYRMAFRPMGHPNTQIARWARRADGCASTVDTAAAASFLPRLKDLLKTCSAPLQDLVRRPALPGEAPRRGGGVLESERERGAGPRNRACLEGLFRTCSLPVQSPDLAARDRRRRTQP